MSIDYRQDYLEMGADRIGLHYYPFPADPDAPIAVILPAMGVPARYYRPFAADLIAAGFGVLVCDLRGTGSSTPRPSRASRYGYPELLSDVAAVLDLPSLAGRRLVLFGHSLGGQLAALHLARHAHDARIDRLVLVAVGLPHFRSYGWRAPLVYGFTQGIAATAALLRVWPGWGFGGRQARGVIRDWGFTARHGRFPHWDGWDADTALAQVRVPVLAVSVDDDQYTPGSTLDRLCAKLVAAPVRRVHYSTAEAGGPLDHFTWVRAGGPLAARIAQFAGVPAAPGAASRNGAAS